MKLKESPVPLFLICCGKHQATPNYIVLGCPESGTAHPLNCSSKELNFSKIPCFRGLTLRKLSNFLLLMYETRLKMLKTPHLTMGRCQITKFHFKFLDEKFFKSFLSYGYQVSL